MKIKELLVLLLLLTPAVLGLLHPGFFGASDDLHIAWLQQMEKTISLGQIPPRYVPDLSYGFGYPLFNFVFPLPFYLGEIFRLVGFSFTYSIKALFVVSLLGSGVAMFLLAKKLSNSLTGIAAAVLYVYTPYRSNDVYNRGALGESLAFIFMPLIIYAFVGLSQSKGFREMWRWVAIGGLSISGLILTHNIVSYMFLPLVFILGIFLFRKSLMRLLLVFLTGLLGSMYFWFPALVDSKLMHYETVFNFIDHFPTIRQLLTPYWGYGASVAGSYDTMSFFMGEVNILVIVLSFGFFLFSYKRLVARERLWWWWNMLIIGVSMVMMNYRSSYLWDHLPLIAYFQFPWRFLTVVTFATALLVVFISKFRFSRIIALLIIFLSIGLNYSRFEPHDYLLRNDDYFLGRYIPVPDPSELYKSLGEEYLRLPSTTKIRPLMLYPRIFPQNESIKVTELDSLTSIITTDSGIPMQLNYNKYNFPGWRGTIDGKLLPLTSGPPFGQIQFFVPSGTHTIRISFGETPLKVFFDIVSFGVMTGSLWYLVVEQRRRRKQVVLPN